jgi:hypothetical protein
LLLPAARHTFALSAVGRLAAAATTAVLVAIPTVVTFAGISASAID